MNLFLFKTLLITTVLTSSIYPSSIKTPTDLGNWMSKTLSYQAEKDGEDYWQTPEETVKKKTADCEDFGILAKYVLTDLGYKPYLIILVNRLTNKGHAICVFRDKEGNWGIFDNTYYNQTYYKSLKKIFKTYYPQYNEFYVSPGKGWGVRIFEK